MMHPIEVIWVEQVSCWSNSLAWISQEVDAPRGLVGIPLEMQGGESCPPLPWKV